MGLRVGPEIMPAEPREESGHEAGHDVLRAEEGAAPAEGATEAGEAPTEQTQSQEGE